MPLTAPHPNSDRKSNIATVCRHSVTALRLLLSILAGTVLAIAGMVVAPATMAGDATNAGHWVGTWNASPQAAGRPVSVNGQTFRQIVRVSIGGTRVRVRLSNAYGAGPLHIGAVRVGLHTTGALREAQTPIKNCSEERLNSAAAS